MQNSKNIREVFCLAVFTEISPIFINCADARRHVTNRFTKCVIAFGFNARPRERHYTRHPANTEFCSRILGWTNIKVGGKRDRKRVVASYSAEAAAWYGTLALLFEIHVDNGKTTSVIVINVIDPDLLSLTAFTDPLARHRQHPPLNLSSTGPSRSVDVVLFPFRV